MAINIYESQELIDNIKTIFTESDIKIFEFNYNLYKNFKGKEKELIIDFEEVRKYLGFTKKENAKRLLIGHFINNKDYKINKSTFTPIGVKVLGRPVEKIMINLNTFKLYSFMASTEQSKKIYDYYINMEKIIIIFMETQLENNKKELENKNNEIENKNNEIEIMKNKLKKFNSPYTELEKNGNVYVMSTDISNIYKIGRTNNIDKRKKSLQTAIVSDIEVLYSYKTCDDKLLEYVIHNILNSKRSTDTEHFKCDIDYIKLIIENIGDILHIFKCCNENITKNELIGRLTKTLNTENSNEVTKTAQSNETINISASSDSSNEIPPKNNIYQQFIEECTEVSTANIAKEKLYDKFRDFYTREISSLNIPNKKIFADNLTKLNYIFEHVNIQTHTENGIINQSLIGIKKLNIKK